MNLFNFVFPKRRLSYEKMVQAERNDKMNLFNFVFPKRRLSYEKMVQVE